MTASSFLDFIGFLWDMTGRAISAELYLEDASAEDAALTSAVAEHVAEAVTRAEALVWECRAEFHEAAADLDGRGTYQLNLSHVWCATTQYTQRIPQKVLTSS